MAKPDVGDRSAWKDRLTDRPWVDGTPWVQAESETEDETDVEFLEAEPSAYRLSQSPKRDSRPSFNTPLTRLLAFGGIAVVLIAVAIMSRPGDQDPFEQLSPIDQQRLLQRQAEDAALAELDQTPEVEGQSDDTTEGDGAPDSPDPLASDTDADSDTGGSEGDVGELSPIPPLLDELPEDLPDLILGFSGERSVFSIRRSVVDSDEIILDANESGGPVGLIEVGDSNVIAFADRMSHIIAADGSLSRRPLPAGVLLPSDDGLMVTFISEGIRQAFVVELPVDGQPAPEAEPILVGLDLELLGAWEGQAVVAKAGKVWLLDENGEATLITDGEVIGFDGRQLTMVRCDDPQACTIEVGPPGQPALTGAVPETLAALDLDEWANGAVASPAGGRLAIALGEDETTEAALIDLATGAVTSTSEPVDGDAPIAWSPDGRYLAFSAMGDLVLWDTESDETWRQPIGRQVSHLAWIVDTEDG